MSIHRKFLSTQELADLIRGKPGSIRTRLCETGSFHGLRPKKLPNGRLLWDGDEAEKLVDGKTSEEGQL